MPNLYVLIGGAVTILGLLLTAFFFFKKSGQDSEKVKTLTQEVADDAKTFDEVASENEFRNRVATDPAYLELMRQKLNPKK